MQYRRTVERTFRNAVENSIGLVFVSILTSLTFVPLLTSVLFQSPFAWVAGLWTTCLTLGIVLVGVASFTETVVSRGVSLGMGYFWAGIRRHWSAGVIIGMMTFAVILVSFLLILYPFTGYVRMTVIVFGVYMLLGWWVWVMFALSVLISEGKSVQGAFTRAGLVLLDRPLAGIWYLIQALGLAALAVLTIVTPFILLPGLLCLLGSQMAEAIRNDNETGDVSL